MTQQVINIGALPNDGTGDTIRVAYTKINQNFTEVYGAIVNGSDAAINLDFGTFTGPNTNIVLDLGSIV